MGSWRGRGFRLTALVLAVVIGGGGAVYWYRGSAEVADAGRPPRAPGRAPVPVSVAIASRRDVPIYLTGLGTVQPSSSVGIHSQVDGKLQEVPFTEGQHVKKGDVLATHRSAPVQGRARSGQGEKGPGRGAARLGAEGSHPLQDAGAQELREPAERRSAAGQGRPADRRARCRRRGDRDGANPTRLHHHHGAERRAYRGAAGRSRQCRARVRCRADRHPDAGAAGGRHVHVALAGARRRAPGHEPRRDRGDRL